MIHPETELLPAPLSIKENNSYNEPGCNEPIVEYPFTIA